MNYASGWLLDTGNWIADHSSLKKATYDPATQKMTADKTATRYAQTFEGMFNYACDWMLSRAAWLSEQYAPYYTPDPSILGDANGDRFVDINDVTAIQRHLAEAAPIEESLVTAADVNADGTVDIADATALQAYLAEYAVAYPIGQPING